MSSLSYSDLLSANWQSLPDDIIGLIVPYISAREVLDLCIRNDTFNRRVCQNQDSIVWKLLYQRDISENFPRDHIASHYLEIMDEVLPLYPNERLLYGAEHGYDEIVKSSLQEGADKQDYLDYSLTWAASNGHTETVKLLLNRGANVSAFDDRALFWQHFTDVPIQSSYC